MTHSTAFSMSASSNTSSALFPPSSRLHGRTISAAASATRLPVATLPVNATLAISGLDLRRTWLVLSYCCTDILKPQQPQHYKVPATSVREWCACLDTQAGDDVEHPPRESDFLGNGSQLQAGHARHFRGLEHAGVAGCKRRCHFPLDKGACCVARGFQRTAAMSSG